MFSIDVQTNVSELQARLNDLQKSQIPYATSRALTDVAFMVRTEEQEEMRRVFKNPTDWTLNGMVVDKAEKNGAPARVRFEESAGKGTPSGKYLRPQIEGGPRGHTPFEQRLIRSGKLTLAEFLVPTRNADRDARGDLNPGQISKILSDLGTIETAQKSANWRDRGTRRAETYTLIKGAGRLPSGIYLQRGAQKILVFLIVRQPIYNAIFDFNGVAQRVIAREFAPAFRRNLERAVQTSKYNTGPRLRSAA